MNRRQIAASVAVFTIWTSLNVTTIAQDKPKPDKMSRVYRLDPEAMYRTMGRAIGQSWKVTHTDKDLCLVNFEARQTMWASALDASATCEAEAEGGTRVRIKVRHDPPMAKSRQEGFAKKVFEAIEAALPPPR